MFSHDLSFRDTLQDLRVEMLRHLTTVAFVFVALAAYSLFFADDFPAPLFAVTALTAAGILALRQQIPLRLNAARYGLLLLAHLCLFAAMRLTGAAWLPFLGVVLVLISGMTTTYIHWLSALAIFGVTALLNNETPYPLAELGATLAVTVAVMQTSVASLYTALRWYSVMQHRADVLLEETRQRQAELAQTVKSLEIAYQNLRRTQQQLVYAQRQADEARRMKERFAANISHELRTPLQSIVGYSELGLTRTTGDRRLQTMFGDIHAAGNRMLALVNNLLDLSRLESTVGHIRLQPVDLAPALLAVRAELQPLAGRRGIHLAPPPNPQPLWTLADPVRLQQVLRNLLANAIRFAPEASDVAIDWRTTPEGRHIISVRDCGPGIPDDELDSIFGAFVQSSRTKSGAGGTGLGLAICRKIVQAHRGRIRASNAPGGGAVFEIRLPAIEPPGDDESQAGHAPAGQAAKVVGHAGKPGMAGMFDAAGPTDAAGRDQPASGAANDPSAAMQAASASSGAAARRPSITP